MKAQSAALALCFTCGCHNCADAAPVPKAAAAEAPAAGAGSVPADRAKQMALMSSDGQSLTDQRIATVQASLKKNPEKYDFWILLGRAWVQKAREAADPAYYANASACAEIAAGLSTKNKDALDLQGLVALNDHRFEDARKLELGVLAKEPDDAVAWGTLSDALLEMGRYPESADAAQKMMDLKPSLPSYSRASYEMWIRGDVEGAKESAKQAMDSGQDFKQPEPWCWVTVQAAMIFWQEGDYPGADSGFDRALALIPNYPPALVGKARVAMAQGDGKRAVELLETAWKESPLVATAWLLGDAQTLAKDDGAAEKSYELVVKHGRQIDRRTLALFFATKNRDHEEAIKLAQAEKLVRDDIYTEDALSWALFRAGQLADARAASDKAMSLKTPDARLMYHAGAIRVAQGDKKAGLDLVQKAVALNPDFDLTGGREAVELASTK